jgi:hypothetical protein
MGGAGLEPPAVTSGAGNELRNPAAVSAAKSGATEAKNGLAGAPADPL